MNFVIPINFFQCNSFIKPKRVLTVKKRKRKKKKKKIRKDYGKSEKNTDEEHFLFFP